jgi:hypothetical protein
MKELVQVSNYLNKYSYKMKKYRIIIFLLFVSFYNSFSQTDSVSVIKIDSVLVPEKQDIMYKIFIENKEPISKHLWKLNLINCGLLKFEIGYEQYISPNWSTAGYLSLGVNGDFLDLNSTYLDERLFKLEQTFRYYFNFDERERYNKKTSGFSGDYLATIISFTQKKYSNFGSFGDSTNWDYDNFHETERNLNLGIEYGLQRSIGRFGYVEFFTGWYYQYKWEHKERYLAKKSSNEFRHTLTPFVGIKAGIAIGSFNNLIKRLKY